MVRNRETYYRSLGWNSLDAHEQAERDLEGSKTSPVERAHMTKARPPSN